MSLLRSERKIVEDSGQKYVLAVMNVCVVSPGPDIGSKEESHGSVGCREWSAEQTNTAIATSKLPVTYHVELTHHRQQTY